MKLLDHKQIVEKSERLAYQILENNYEFSEIIFLGINENGLRFAKILQEAVNSISEDKARLGSININAAHPLKSEIVLDIDLKHSIKK